MAKIESAHLYGEREQDIWTSAYEAGKAAARSEEKKRCEGWVQAARQGHIDTDLRSIISAIRSDDVFDPANPEG